MEGRIGERKRRSDKKVDVKPTMSITLKEQLYKFAELCDEPVKDITERLCLHGLVSKSVMDEMCKWFRRNYYYNSTMAIGHIERPRLKLNFQGETGKITIRFKQRDYDKLSELAYSLDLTPTSTAAVLIRMTFKNAEFMQNFMNTLSVDDKQKEVVFRYLRKCWGFR